jgi:hypothetical protein
VKGERNPGYNLVATDNQQATRHLLRASTTGKVWALTSLRYSLLPLERGSGQATRPVANFGAHNLRVNAEARAVRRN